MRTITIGDLSRTEWKIMKICWEKGQSTAKVVYEESLKEKKHYQQKNNIELILF